MASYEQYCGLAKALDVIGDRWTLLIIRELLSRGPLRYTDLRDGLPGIATNLLANRLRDLEKAGVIRRDIVPPPMPATLFSLTPRGQDLRSAIVELGKWGVPLLAQAPETDTFRAHWLAWPVEIFLRDGEPDGPPVAIQVLVGDQAVVVESVGGTVRTRIGHAERPDAVLRGSPAQVAGALMGVLSLDQARASGMHFEGSSEALRRLQSA